MKKVLIYSTPTCPYCIQAKEYFKEKGIKYEEKDVASDDKAREEMTKKSGSLAVPVIIIGDEVIVGFDKDAVNKALEIK
ncbi:MAG: glutaredoxin family protein [Parcubacteria group bacterium]|nr:glutaredoxin family protein [Parcubacteria group bacterium]